MSDVQQVQSICTYSNCFTTASPKLSRALLSPYHLTQNTSIATKRKWPSFLFHIPKFRVKWCGGRWAQ